MKKLNPAPFALTLGCLVVAGVILSGCTTRSISNSGYRAGGYYGGSLYRGELNEFDVLGVDRDQAITDTDIARALDNPGRVSIRRGSSILLIQSGAMIPDEPIATELNKFARVVQFSGIPSDPKLSQGAEAEPATRASYSKSLRLAAAKGGCESIVCYWGVLESAREGLATKPVSWVPLVGGALPDERQRMRIRLKVAVMDVRSGNWSIYSPAPFEDKAMSGRYTREGSDQAQVEKLKHQAYTAAVQDLMRVYGG